MVLDPYLHVRLPAKFKQSQTEQLLAEKYAFTLEPPISETWVFYDTFDWGLCNQSLVLRKAGQELILDRLSGVESLSVFAGSLSPEFAWDLPESQLRKRIEPIIKMRALLPLASIQVASNDYRILNKAEKTVARLVATELQTLDSDRESILSTYLSLHPVRGYPNYSRKLAKLLGKAGQKVSLIEDLYLGALEKTGKVPCSYSGKLNVQLKPKKRSDVSAKVILRRLFEIMLANEPGILADIDTEFLHDYRIAIRRTRSALSQIRNVFPDEDTEHFKNSFRFLGQRTNKLRDLDVYLLSEDEFEARLPATMRDDILPLFDYLRVLREGELAMVADSLSSSDYAQALGEWEAYLNESVPKKPVAANAAVPLVELAQKRIYQRYRRVIEYGNLILTHTQDELLHALRIECKKLRYLMEFFASLFPEEKMIRMVNQLKKLQDNLGEFNDLSVQQEYLLGMAEELPINESRSRRTLVATGYLVENLSYEQKAVKAEFADTFKEFASPTNQKTFRRLFATRGKKRGR